MQAGEKSVYIFPFARQEKLTPDQRATKSHVHSAAIPLESYHFNEVQRDMKNKRDGGSARDLKNKNRTETYYEIIKLDG